jgi:hypothetical protein
MMAVMAVAHLILLSKNKENMAMFERQTNPEKKERKERRGRVKRKRE